MNSLKNLRIVLFIFLIGMPSITLAQESATITKEPRVVHTVLFKFTDQANQSQIDKLMTHIKSLKQDIFGIQTISLGQNFSERSKGYTYSVTITFTNKTALANFIIHPVHQELIKDFIKPILAEMIIVDYEDDVNLKKQ